MPLKNTWLSIGNITDLSSEEKMSEFVEMRLKPYKELYGLVYGYIRIIYSIGSSSIWDPWIVT